MHAKVYFISDLHLGHDNILLFERDYREGEDIEEHDQWLIDSWNSIVTAKDIVYVLGDVAWTRAGLNKLKQLKGNKNLIMGNHDKYFVDEYMAQGFRVRPGVMKYKEFWLSHAPIHPAELRGLKNIHGHVHENTLDDPRYINVCVEPLDGTPMYLEDIRAL